MDTITPFDVVAIISSAAENAAHCDQVLDDSLMDSFPASDPISSFDFRTPPALPAFA
jgi:hypothetical protein